MKVIIIGAGEIGFNIARKLSSENKDVILIDSSEEKIRRAQECLDVQCILGRGSRPGILKEAGIDTAEIVIAVTNSDEVNMIACLIAGSQSKVPVKIARIRDPDYTGNNTILGKEHLGIDLVINPEREAADKILRLLEVPGATEIVEFAEGKVKLVEFLVEPGSYVAGKRLKELDETHPNQRVLIASISRGNKLIIPKGEDAIQVGDLVSVVTVKNAVSEVQEVLGKKNGRTKTVMISGVGFVGLYLAQKLEERGLSVKVIENDAVKCSELAEKLNRTIVLQGDSSDQSLLLEENINEVDAFLAVSQDEEANILSSLLAKRLGAKRVYALVNKSSYMPVVTTIGVDVMVSPRLAAVGRILQFVRRGRVLSVAQLDGEEAEAIEFVALETSDIVNKPLKNLRFPKGAIVGAVVRGEEIIIPRGNDSILPDDRVIIFALGKAIPKVEKALTVKLEYF
ncbi:MAG: Trk system potassium transporter TrkA [Deltaproteobacteria bacterium]|nr:MAG: Trk system potassium transporter TrkA [Deltaproteobacteria bacterium]